MNPHIDADGRLRHLLDGPLRAVQQLHRAGAAHLVFQALQRGTFFLQLPVQRARRDMQQRGQ